MYKKANFMVIGLVAGLAANASAAANAPVVTLGGTLDTQIGHQSQKRAFDVDLNDHRRNSYGIVNDTKMRIKADGHAHGFKYGGLIVLNTDTSTSKQKETSVGRQTMMYVESCLGRLEAGSYVGAYDTMKVSGSTIARATGGIDGDWKYWVNTDVDSTFDPATISGLNILSYKPTLPTSFDKSYEDNAAKITYYTPTLGDFKVGVTYVPDTEQHGTVTNLKGLTKSYAAFSSTTYNQTRSFTNVLQGGILYKHKFDKVGFSFSALGEIGDAKKVLIGATTFDRHDLRAYEIGAKLTYMGFGVAGSYGDWGKTGLFKTRITALGVATNIASSKAGKYWTAGANYVRNCLGMSFGYLSAENGGFGADLSGVSPAYSPTKGKASLYSFGVDYKVAPGFMPYAEVTQFSLKDKTRGSAGKNSGTVILAGTKLEF